MVIQNPAILAFASVEMTSPLELLMGLISHDHQRLLTYHLHITGSSKALNLMSKIPC
jgi:hypothetical protein